MGDDEELECAEEDVLILVLLVLEATGELWSLGSFLSADDIEEVLTIDALEELAWSTDLF